MYREPFFIQNFLVPDTNFSKKLFAFSENSLELTKIYYPKTISPNELRLYIKNHFLNKKDFRASHSVKINLRLHDSKVSIEIFKY
jgi:hypothetical protein